MNEDGDFALALRYAFLAYGRSFAPQPVFVGVDYSAEYKEELAKKAEKERQGRFRVIQGGKQ